MLKVEPMVLQDVSQAPYVVRSATIEDGAVIARILTEVGREGIYIANEGTYMTSEQQSLVLSRLNPQQHLILVAEQNGVVVGTLEIVRGVFQKNAHTANFGMALVPAARGRHIGEGLLRAAHEWAKVTGIEKICLSVFSSNTGAIRLYQRMGYHEEGRRRNQYRLGGVFVDEVFMAWYLPPQSAN
jgi:ribosomal protein S18 acetylase RimI-like enzyme